MPLDALRLGDCAQGLQEHGISREIVRHCLRSFSEARDEGKMNERVDEEGDDDEGVLFYAILMIVIQIYMCVLA